MKRPLRSSRWRRELMAGLEPRCLFSTVTGTPGNDLIELHVNGSTAFFVNGVATGKTTSAEIRVDALDGDDTIVIKSTGYGSFNIPGLDVYVRGQGGNDTLEVDDSAYEGDAMYEFGPFALECQFRLPGGVTTYHYGDSVENVTLDQNDRGAATVVEAKPAAMRLRVNANGGDDQVFVGSDPFETYPNRTGGDLDSDGMDNVTLLGGAGRDSVAFHDADDRSDPGESETLVLDFFTATKGGTRVTYSAFEKQAFALGSSMTAGQLVAPSEIQVNAVSGFVEETVIHGGLDRPSVIKIGNGTTSNLSGVFRVDGCANVYGHNSHATLIADDAASPDAATWQVFSDRLVKGATGQTVHYANVDVLQVRTGVDYGRLGARVTDVELATADGTELAGTPITAEEDRLAIRWTSDSGDDVFGDTAILADEFDTSVELERSLKYARGSLAEDL